MIERPSGIPSTSGCYLFRNARGVVIYVGKARSLQQRLANYFQRLDALTYKTQALMNEATSVEWIVTGSEVDALILENELIKTHQPRYNMRLKDDKSFPFLALDYRSAFPHPYTTRGSHVKGVTYYGPFAHVGPLRRTVDELIQAFPLRTCSNHKFEQHRRLGRPCLLYDVGKCSGPCVGLIESADYAELVESFGSFFDGHVSQLRQRLEEQMRTAATSQHYEGAARARDGLHALERAAQTQRVVLDDSSNLDCFGVVTTGSRAAVTLHRVRGGRIVGRHALLMDLSLDESPVSIIERTLPELYRRDGDVPAVVLVDEAVTPTAVLSQYLGRRRGKVVTVSTPLRGKRRQLLALVRADAQGVLDGDSTRRTHDHNVRSRALEELGSALGLSQPPYRIECFDMSHLQGTNYVGSMVVFEDGLPKRSDYRHYNVKTVLGNDDAGAMREVLERRLGHWNESGGDAKFRNADLFIIDGGLPQLHASMDAAAARADGGASIEFVALAKREELLYRPGRSEPVVLERGSEALYLVQRVRDEAHRFAITFHRSKRGKAMVHSVLDGIDGLGVKRQQLLVTHVGSLEEIRRATLDELRAVPGLPENVARTLYDHLHPVGSFRLKKEDPPNE
jgi:excinuclease ABC subunit C